MSNMLLTVSSPSLHEALWNSRWERSVKRMEYLRHVTSLLFILSFWPMMAGTVQLPLALCFPLAAVLLTLINELIIRRRHKADEAFIGEFSPNPALAHAYREDF
ncbi:hypothetical protein [Arthrobacter flavus]|uniref:Uncharacterized protein n=1 Tax=Arthrobacter flavus TaxID=95172 RepID=A0ABW4Q568_9MICC